MISTQFEILEKINEIRELFNDLEIESTRKNLNFKEMKKILDKIDDKNSSLKLFLTLFYLDELPF